MSNKKSHIAKEFEVLFQYNFRPLCIYALHYLEDVIEAEDVAQNSFMKLWEKTQAGVQVPNKKAYLYATVRNMCLDKLKKHRIQTEPLKAHETYGIVDDEQVQEDSQIESRLWTAIDSLPDKCRQIFLLSKRDGLKYEEIAQELEISVNTVRNQVSKALKTIKEGAHNILIFIFA